MNIFTDGLNIAMDLPVYPEIHSELFGGTIDRRLMRLSGSEVLSAMDQLHFDYAFLGVMGFHPERGFSCSAAFTATIKKAISRADKVVILMDSSKVNYIRAPRNVPLGDVDAVVSDGKLPSEIVRLLTDSGITVY